jgi:hypothetical protein
MDATSSNLCLIPFFALLMVAKVEEPSAIVKKFSAIIAPCMFLESTQF